MTSSNKNSKASKAPTIVQQSAPVLRDRAEPVKSEEFGTAALRATVKAMSDALATCDDGVALAAPQIGVSKRIFVVAGKILNPEAETVSADLVFINPTITKQSKRAKFVDEGCLSVRWLYGRVKRSTKATVEAQDLEGRKITHHGTGLLAQIFQHEIDHLNGVLFTDKAEDLQEIKPENLDD